MHKQYFSLYFLMWLLMAAALPAAAQSEGIKKWSSRFPLQWADFTGKPDSPETPYAAATYAGLALDVAEVKYGGRVKFTVYAVFDCKRSWAHPQRQDNSVLAHEQLHFDIAEVYARKLQRKLNALPLKVSDRNAVKQLVYKYNQAQMQEQDRFDRECVHGLDRQNQQVWRAKVDKELNLKRGSSSLAAVQE